jgi:hypothetical protein
MDPQQAELEYRFRQRQQDVFPPEAARRLPVTLIGAGGVNSNVALLASKLGLDLTVYDGDQVDAENVNAQVFGPAHLGKPKPEAVKEICLAHAGVEVRAVNSFVTGGEDLRGIVVEAVDSMAEREKLWETAILPYAPAIDTYVSVRMGAESGSLFLVRPNSIPDRIWYESSGLYSDEEALPLPCTAKATSYCASCCAALAVSQVKRLLMEQPTFRRIDFDLDTFMFTVEE